MSDHAILSASGSHRWLECPGSVKAECGLSSEPSIHADKGRVAHALAEDCLSNNISPLVWLDKPWPGHNDVDREMCEAVQDYIDYLEGFQEDNFIMDYERRVDFSQWVPGGFGTADAIAFDGNTIHVIDLKYGKGIRVEAKDNPQLMLYALGAYSELSLIYDPIAIKVSIVQPRLDHIDEWCVSIEYLLLWGRWASDQAKRALSNDAERIPGEKQCQWCLAKAICPALDAYIKSVVGDDFENLDNPDTLSQQKIREVLEAKKLIIGWLDAVEQYVTGKLESGEGFKGFKLVAGRSNRQWQNDQEAEKALIELLAEDAFERKLLSPSKAEKAIGKAKRGLLEGLIVKPEGKPTLASEADPRPAVNIQEEDFDELT